MSNRGKKVIVPIEDLVAIHNLLLATNPTGELIIGTGNSIMTLRRLIDTAPRVDDASKPKADAEEVPDATDEND